MKFDLSLFKDSPYRFRESFSTLIEKDNFVTKKLIFTQLDLLLKTHSHPNLIKSFNFGISTGYLLSNTKNYVLILQLGPILELWTKQVSKKDKDLFEDDLNLKDWTKVSDLTLNKTVLSLEKWNAIYEKEKEVVSEFESVASLWGQVYIDAVLKENGIVKTIKSDFEKIAFLSFKMGSIEFRKISAVLLPPVLHGQALKDLLAISYKNKKPSLFVKTSSLSDALNSLFLLLEQNNTEKVRTPELFISLLKKDRLIKITHDKYNYYIYRAHNEDQTSIEVHRLPLNNNFSQIKQYSCQRYNSLMFKSIDNNLIFLGGYSNDIWDLIDICFKQVHQ